MKTSTCPNCGTAFTDRRPRNPHTCEECGTEIKPRRATERQCYGSVECRACAQPATTEVAGYRLCPICAEFSAAFSNKESLMRRYCATGGAMTWMALGKRILFDKIGRDERVEVLIERDVPDIPGLRRRPGAKTRGGAPFGFRDEDGVLVKDEEQQLTLQMIQTMLYRKASYRAIARELIDNKRTNKRGEVKWSPATVRFLARREGWA